MHSDPLIITFANEAVLQLLDIWIASLRRLGLQRVRVYSLDAATLTWCSDHGVEAMTLPCGGSRAELWQARIGVFCKLLVDGEEFIHSDTDAIWIRNPLKEGSACGLRDHLVFSQGTWWPPDVHARQGFVLCGGWFWARPADATHEFFLAVEEDAKTSRHDQASINRVLATAGARWSRVEGDYELTCGERLFRCWSEPIRATLDSSHLTVALLPHREFQRLPEKFDGVIVRHFLTPRSCVDKIRALHELQAFGN
jgi:hypothetical protein